MWSKPMRFAYADPPYIGQAKRHYSHDPLCAEVDHAELIQRLTREFPDGWALSASAPSLATILPLCPSGYRVAVWVKTFCAFKRNVRPPTKPAKSNPAKAGGIHREVLI